MKSKSIETFGVKVVDQYTDKIVDMIFGYIEHDPLLKKEYQSLVQEYGSNEVKERLITLIENHFGVNNKKEKV